MPVLTQWFVQYLVMTCDLSNLCAVQWAYFLVSKHQRDDTHDFFTERGMSTLQSCSTCLKRKWFWCFPIRSLMLSEPWNRHGSLCVPLLYCCFSMPGDYNRHSQVTLDRIPIWESWKSSIYFNPLFFGAGLKANITITWPVGVALYYHALYLLFTYFCGHHSSVSKAFLAVWILVHPELMNETVLSRLTIQFWLQSAVKGRFTFHGMGVTWFPSQNCHRMIQVLPDNNIILSTLLFNLQCED